MFLADLLDVLDRTAQADRRADKVSGLAKLLRRTAIEDVESVVALTVETIRPTHDVAEWAVAEVTPAIQSSLTVDEVRRVVDEVAIASGPQATERASRMLLGIAHRATAGEQALIESMLDPNGESLVSASVMSSAIAAAARVRVGDVRRAASVTGSLAMTATLAFVEGTTALESVEPRAGRPIQPMQAAPTDAVDEALFESTCVEWVSDGLRLQAHRAGRTVSLFVFDGVNPVDVTDRLPRVVALVLSMPGDDLVLDGELDGPDMPGPTDDGSDRRVKFFDLLFDGEALLDRPLAHRRRALELVVPAEHRLTSVETSDPAEVDLLLAEAHASGRLGVVLKDLESVYEPGQRGRSWRVLVSSRTLNLVVVAAEWGTGRRSDKLSRLHLAARTARGEFEIVGKTALGVTDEMLRWQTDRLKQLAVVGGEHQNIVTVRPEQVVEVAFESVHEVGRGSRTLSLRSARVRRYRTDKHAAESDTIETVRGLVRGDERTQTDDGAEGPSLRRRAGDVPAAPTEEDAPRLPPARAPGLDAAQAEAAKRIREVLADREHAEPAEEEPPPTPAMKPPASLPVSGYLRGHIASLDLDFVPYEEPVLETGRATHMLVMLARFITLGWAVALTTSALITRSEPGAVDPSLVEIVGWAGIPVVLALAVTGWAWSDHLTRNLKRLDGRLPSRLRCVTAWLAPLLTVAVLAVSIVRLEPTDVVDVRPSILVGLFAVFMWRPYALIRRIFATLIRIRFDALLATGYVLDLVGFGLLWWRLTVWSTSSEPITIGDVEILIGIGAAVSVALAANVIVWRAIVRAGDRAEAHRAASQRTRYEHRMLRLRGVDPTDPEVWWALVQRRADEQRAEEERAAALAELADLSAEELVGVSAAAGSAPAVVPTVDELVDSVKQKHSVAFRRLGDEESDQLVLRLREQFSTVVGDLAGMPLEDAPESDEAPVAKVGEPTITDEPTTEEPSTEEPATETSEDDATAPAASVTEASDAPVVVADEPPSILRTIAERAGTSVEPEPDSEVVDEPAEADEVRLSPLERLAARSAGVDEVPAAEADAPSVGDVERPVESPGETRSSPLERLAARSAGVDEVPAAEADAPSVGDVERPVESPGETRSSPLERLAARSAGVHEVPAAGAASSVGDEDQSNADDEDQPSEETAEPDGAKPSPLERLAASASDVDEPSADKSAVLRARLESVESASGADPVSALKRRLGLDESVEDVKSPLEQLLGQAGTVQVEAALAERRQQEIEERPTERLVPPRLYALEWTRLLLVTAFAVVTAAGGWLVSESLGASGSSSDGSLGVAAADVDLARRAFVSAYSVAVTLIPLWTYAVLTYARRCGMESAKPRRHLAMFACSALLCVLAFVVDAGVRGTTSAMLLIPAALIAAVAGYLVEPARFWFDLPSVTLTIWTVAVPVLLGVSWVGGLLQPMDPDASLQWLAFFTVTVSLISALITVLIALSASDIEDEIRLSPELAVPLSQVGRGRS